MKILVTSLAQCFRVPNEGYGGDSVVTNLLRGFADIGVHADFAAPTGSLSPAGKLIDTGPPTGDWSGNDTAYNIFSKYFDDYDLIHSNQHDGLSYEYKLNGGATPLVHTLQGISIWKGAPPTSKPNLITHSSWYRKAIKENWGADSRVASLAICPEDFQSNPPKRDVDLFFGLMVYGKGAHEAISMAYRAGRRLTVAGEIAFGCDQQYVNDIKDLCKKCGFEFIPSPSHEEKLRLLAEARSVIMPFQVAQTSSYIALEALASGTDVFIAQHSGLTELPCQPLANYPGQPREPRLCRNMVEPFSAVEAAKRHRELYTEAIEQGGW